MSAEHQTQQDQGQQDQDQQGQAQHVQPPQGQGQYEVQTTQLHATERPAEVPSAVDGSDLDSSGVDGLLSQLRVIEDQPLADRATAFTQIHDRLRSRLEGGDSQNRHA